MQNFTDVWGVILDDNCKPLVGKIGFYEPNTTTLKNIFGTDEVIPLDNPVYCNGVTTSQVLLDEGDYTEKLTEIISNNDIASVTIVRMEVPCCGGLQRAAENAIKNSGKFLPWQVVTISRNGDVLD